MSASPNATSKPKPREIQRDVDGRPVDVPAEPAILDHRQKETQR